ncbi:MAG: amino acid adenylation domain-containing protein, partial [Chloroflexi bacterium]|nr:amino acid adenylation domain-containing protein [Chloroflexota bacterium]
GPNTPIMQLPLLTDAERQQIVHGWNATATDVPTRCVHDLVAAQAAQTPDAIALVCGAEHVTYAALERQANQLAQVLAVRGVGPETCVAILLDRSLDLIVASLAILKAGGAYLPLDPASPPERLAWLLADAHAAVVVTQQALAARLPQDVAVLALDREQQAIDQAPIVPVTTHAGLDQLAYVIYTSGSTGQPKGVAVPHAGLANLVAWHQQTYHIQPRDRASVVASPAFDASVWEIWPYLASGAQLHLPDDATRSDPAALVGWLQAHDITLSFLPTALAEAALAQPWPASTALRALLVGGDQLHPLPEGLPFPVYNHYGPTESTVVASWQPVAFDSAGSLPPIGRPIANTTIYLLDRYLQPVPVGVAGELYIGGVGVARGYLHRPDLTAERFVPDLFTDRPGQRLYRTGDLARYQVDGVLDYLGRIDQQVKLRGYRIELGEIEATLRAHEAVHDAVVVLRDDRLVAYIVGEQTNKGTSEQENKASTDSPPSPVATGEGSGVRAYGEGWPAMLRAFLAQRLPAYMLPSAFVTLAALPVTPSGKVDRRALPAPDRADLFASTGYVPLATPTEHIVAGVWAEVLGVAQIGRHDHFFALGGHSLNATQVIARLRTACGLDLPLPLIFEHPQLSVLAAAIDQALPGASTPDALPPLVPQPHQADQPLPLSFAQQRLWFLDQLITRRAVYNIPGAFQLRGELDLRALECSLTAIVERHEILRTVFVLDGDQPVQVVLPAQPVSVALEDLRAQSRQIAEELVERLAVAEAQRPFDLRRGPLLRATLLRLADNEHVLLIAVHHIAADGWSLRIFMRELAAQYTAEVRGQPADMPSLPVQYADYALWQRNWLHGAVLEQQLDYWRRQLSDLPALQLPTDFSRPAQPTFNGASQPLALASDVTEALRDLSRREGTTLFQTLLAIFQVLLARYSGQDDIVVGAPIAGRTQREVEPLIGYFGNTLVLRANLSGQPDFREVLQRVRETTLAAYAHQDLPFDQLVDALQPDRDLSRSPLFQVLFDLQHDLPVGLELPGLRLQQMPLKQGVAKFDLSLLLVETPEGLHGRIEYSTDLFAATTIARMAGHLQKLATEIAATPNTPVALLPLLTDAERQQIVHGWNATATEVPTRCVHDLVTAQAAQTPAAIALVCGTEQLTYAELERRANQLAQVLAARGVGPETCVAILLDRSLDLIIASLAILKAGGAYLPLDPATPPERIAWLLADARASLVVTQQALAVRLPQDVAVLALDREQQAIDRAPTMPLAVATSGDQLAYIIYTSGSTGQPKGVAVPHAGLANLVAWHQQTYHIQPRDRASVVASPAFDASVWEIWPYLASGAQLHIPAEETRSDPAALVGWLHAQQITLSFLPTALAEAALAQTWSAPTALRALLVGGDQLHPLPEDRAVPVYNHYGPTESTVVASWQPVAFDSAGSLPPIGRPIANTTIYLLDRYLQPVPVGVAGELYIGGVGVARGYLHRPDLTAERFVPDPFSDTAGSRLYRTGDLARFQVDGVLDYLGRIDQQVKLRGYRIELGEIEAALRQHEAVHDAVVVVREESGDKRLVAYVVQNLEPRTKNLGDAEGGSRFLGLGSALRQHLSARLPAYMLPSAIVMLAALPLTSSGKVERRALPAPDRADLLESTGYVPLATPTEHLVAGVWAEVLGVAQIGRHDHFFALGGHSLNAT